MFRCVGAWVGNTADLLLHMRHASTPAPCCRYVYLMMGVIIGSAVCPIAFCMVWSKCTASGAVSGALIGLAAAVCAWLGYTKANYGVVNLATTGGGCRGCSQAFGCKRCARTSRM